MAEKAEPAPVEAPAPAPAPATTATEVTKESAPPEYDGSSQRPVGWQYKGIRVLGSEIWFASPKMQLFLVAIVCFLCPGMFNALTGMGGGGQIDTKPSNDANTALYSTFSVVAFFAGTIANVLGVRLTLSMGGIGYAVYAASFLSYSHTKNHGFVVFAGALLGVCAGLLWTAQGAIMMSYPTEENKGRYISWFWGIFNLGAVLGSCILLGLNADNTAGPVTDGTYAGFIVLMFLGAVLALFLCNANMVIREDGSKVILMKNPTWKTEFKGLYQTITAEPWIALLFPYFFASNTFYTYQLNDMNAPHFSTRARALNNLLYWSAQIFAALLWGYALDYQGISRSLRAKINFGVITALTFVIWGGGWAWQKQQVPREITEAEGYAGKTDWHGGGEKYVAPLFLYFFYGWFDAVWQTSAYWYMGALSNSGRKTANLAGFYKGIQSAGAAVWWALDGAKVPFNSMFGATWGTLAGSLLFAAPVIFLKIKDTIPVEQDLKFSDETVEDVLAPKALATLHHEQTKEV